MTKKNFDQLNTLSLLEWQLLITSAIFLPLTALGLHLFGLKRTQEIMEKFSPPTPRTYPMEEQRLQYGQMVTRMVSAAANHSIYQANCLKKSLVAWWILRRKGIEIDLHIGVQKEGEVLHAHSWIELNGKILIDDENTIQRFCTLM